MQLTDFYNDYLETQEEYDPPTHANILAALNQLTLFCEERGALDLLFNNVIRNIYNSLQVYDDPDNRRCGAQKNFRATFENYHIIYDITGMAPTLDEYSTDYHIDNAIHKPEIYLYSNLTQSPQYYIDHIKDFDKKYLQADRTTLVRDALANFPIENIQAVYQELLEKALNPRVVENLDYDIYLEQATILQAAFGFEPDQSNKDRLANHWQQYFEQFYNSLNLGPDTCEAVRNARKSLRMVKMIAQVAGQPYNFNNLADKIQDFYHSVVNVSSTPRYHNTIVNLLDDIEQVSGVERNFTDNDIIILASEKISKLINHTHTNVLLGENIKDEQFVSDINQTLAYLTDITHRPITLTPCNMASYM